MCNGFIRYFLGTFKYLYSITKVKKKSGIGSSLLLPTR